MVMTWRITTNVFYSISNIVMGKQMSVLGLPGHCDTAHNLPVYTRGIWWSAAGRVGAAVSAWRQGRSSIRHLWICLGCSLLGFWGHSTVYPQSTRKSLSYSVEGSAVTSELLIKKQNADYPKKMDGWGNSLNSFTYFLDNKMTTRCHKMTEQHYFCPNEPFNSLD